MFTTIATKSSQSWSWSTFRAQWQVLPLTETTMVTLPTIFPSMLFFKCDRLNPPFFLVKCDWFFPINAVLQMRSITLLAYASVLLQMWLILHSMLFFKFDKLNLRSSSNVINSCYSTPCLNHSGHSTPIYKCDTFVTLSSNVLQKGQTKLLQDIFDEMLCFSKVTD